MGVFGQYAGGVLGQRLHLERNLLTAIAAAFPFILIMSFTRDTFLLIMALVYFFFNFALQPMLNVLLAQNTTVEMRGPAFGVYFFASFGIGSLASSFSGYIAERFGLHWVFLGLSGSVLLSVFFSYVLLRLKAQHSRSALRVG
jgi:predicted MFS family arabinose efflux permease